MNIAAEKRERRWKVLHRGPTCQRDCTASILSFFPGHVPDHRGFVYECL
jgi:hypothetical protein